MNNPKHTSITMKFLARFHCNKNILLLHWTSLKNKEKYTHMSPCYLSSTPTLNITCARGQMHLRAIKPVSRVKF